MKRSLFKIKIFFLWKFLLITKKEVGATHQKAFKLMLLMETMMIHCFQVPRSHLPSILVLITRKNWNISSYHCNRKTSQAITSSYFFDNFDDDIEIAIRPYIERNDDIDRQREGAWVKHWLIQSPPEPHKFIPSTLPAARQTPFQKTVLCSISREDLPLKGKILRKKIWILMTTFDGCWHQSRFLD